MIADLLKTVIDHWPAIIELAQGNVFLLVCVLLSTIWLLSLYLDSKGFLAPWSSESKKSIQATLMGLDRGAHRTQLPISLGVVLTPKLEAIAKADAKKLRPITTAQTRLGRCYSKVPFHPDAWNRALIIAYGYSIAFFIFPWLAGGEGRLGATVLLPKDAAWLERFSFALVLLISGLLVWATATKRIGDRLAILGAGVWSVCALILLPKLLGNQSAPYAGAGAVAVAFSLFYERISDSPYVRGVGQKKQLTSYFKGVSVLLFVLVLVLIVGVTMPVWLGVFMTPRDSAFVVNSWSFTLFFFLAVLPTLNALFDYLSVGITQVCLAKMTSSKAGIWLWVVDAIAALILVTGLYAVVYGAMLVMRLGGWELDATGIFKSFAKDPGSSIWLLMLAVTNLIPSILHWGLWISGVLLHKINPRLREAPALARKSLDNEPLEKLDAGTLAAVLRSGHHITTSILLVVLMAWASFAIWKVVPVILKSLLGVT